MPSISREVFISPRGVAPVIVSREKDKGFGTGQLVMATGKLMRRKTRATRAGLKGLYPRPPYTCFPIPMATIAPITIIHQGIFDGRFMARRSPVRTALPSLRGDISMPLIFRTMASKARQASMDIVMTLSAFSPKK